MVETRLYAVTAGGLRAVATPARAASVHELFDAFPPGVYSALRTYGGVRFLRLDLHLARTRLGLELAGWPGFDEGELRAALHEAVTAWPHGEARARFDVLSEPARSEGAESRIWIALSPLDLPPAELLRDGVRVELTRELRRAHPRVKNTRFVVQRRPYPCHTRERYEHLMVAPDGRLLECTSANFFGVQDGVVRTSGDDVLEGVTLRILGELARGLEIPFRTEALREGDLPRLSEAFLSSSVRGLVPIVGAGATTIGAGVPGPVYRRLADAYAEHGARESRPAVEADAAGRQRP
jgi:branched-subunit amino acid aminotransferase/4-amino-4-deoxychorismate lyase